MEPCGDLAGNFCHVTVPFQIMFHFDSLRRRANARNFSFRVSLRWPIHIINSVHKAKLSCNTPYRRNTTVSSETYPLYSHVPFQFVLFSGTVACCYISAVALCQRPSSRSSSSPHALACVWCARTGTRSDRKWRD